MTRAPKSISLLLASAASLFIYASSAQSPIWEGIYTEQQASRGSTEYNARCASCHAADLRGNSNTPSLLGLSFMFIWEGKSLGDLYTKMRSEMPTDQPGSLPAQSYADILAFILMSNEFPAGEHEVAANGSGLDDILIAPQ